MEASPDRAERWVRWLAPLGIAALAILAWDLVVRLNGIPPYILPGPGLVAQSLVKDFPILWPSLLVTLRITAMALAAALGPSLFNSMMAVAIVRIPAYVRLARGQTLSLREQVFVKAARTYGASPFYILRWHLLPNAMSPIIVQATLDLGGVVLIAAALSFIGLGAQPPTAEWGALVSSGRSYMLDQWWYATFPGLAILITAMGCNLVGDGIRDMLDPRLRGR